MRWRFFHRPTAGEIAPEFLDISEPKLRAQLEKSCGRDLTAAWKVAAKNSGETVREFYLWSADLQARYPLGQLPVGQKRLAKWLLNQGRSQHTFADAEIIAYLRETAADLPRGIAQTYLIMPDWQRRFPRIAEPGEQQKLLRWLREQFPNWRALKQVKLLPLMEKAPAASGVNLLAHFCYPSGLQQGALAAKASLEAMGIPLSCRDVPVGVRTELLPRHDWLGREIFDTSLIIMSPVPYSETAYERAGLDRRSGVYRIACWSWELDTIPAEWPSFEGLFDEIWTPTTFVADAMRTRFRLPVFDMPHSIEMPAVKTISRASLNVPEDHFLFLFMFDLCSEVERKNPFGLIRAFRRAFAPEQKATLLIKTVRAALEPTAFAELEAAARGANIRVVNELADRGRTFGYLEMADAYVSLHRSEGFGLTLAEAMMLGKPVIATGYSGNLDFMNATNSWLVDYELIPVGAGGAIYRSGHWAEPSEKHAAQMMMEVFHERESAQVRAGCGQRDVAELLSPDTIGTRMKARLDAIAGSRRRSTLSSSETPHSGR